MNSIRRVSIYESSLRDGLQALKQNIPTKVKIGFGKRLEKAGFKNIEVGSVTKIEQMRDSEAVFKELNKSGSAKYWTLVPNPKGLHKAIMWGCRHFGIPASASDPFSRANIRRGITEAYEDWHLPMLQKTAYEGIKVRFYLSCSFGYKSPDDVTEEVVVTLGSMAHRYNAKIVLSDTMGWATPDKVRRLFQEFWNEGFLPSDLAFHPHGPPKRVMENTAAAIQEFIKREQVLGEVAAGGFGLGEIDATIRNFGGCPAAQKAAGRDLNNVPTQDVISYCNAQNILTGVDLEKVNEASNFFISSL